jgi:hypothetical protein
MGSTARKIFVEPKRDSLSNYKFTYNASADVLEATITQPLQATLEEALATLPPTGGYVTATAKPFQLGKLISYTGGYAQVSGFQNPEGNYVTVATAVVEGLNIQEILSADRVVAQITTTMAPGDSVQSVSFEGSSISNLQVSSNLITVSVNADALGAKPADGGSYFDNVPVGMTASSNTLTGTILTPTSIPQIVLAGFGTISLAQLTVTQTPKPQAGYTYDYKLVMIKADLSGGGADGCVIVAMGDPNGGGGGTTP